MEKKKRGAPPRYDAAFKTRAIKMVTESGDTVKKITCMVMASIMLLAVFSGCKKDDSDKVYLLGYVDIFTNSPLVMRTFLNSLFIVLVIIFFTLAFSLLGAHSLRFYPQLHTNFSFLYLFF